MDPNLIPLLLGLVALIGLDLPARAAARAARRRRSRGT